MKDFKKEYIKWLTKLSKIRSRQGLYPFLATEFSKIPCHSVVLTVGAGGQINDLLAEYATRQSFKCISFDIDNKRKPDLVGDICHYDFQESTFDVVVISEVLEHLHSPHLGLNNINKILRKGGTVILSTPFMLPIHDEPYDYFRFTRYGLKLLLKDFGNVVINERNSYFEAIDVMWLRLLQDNLQSAKNVSLLIIPWVFFIKRPMSILLAKLVPTYSMTTGYTATAVKK